MAPSPRYDSRFPFGETFPARDGLGYWRHELWNSAPSPSRACTAPAHRWSPERCTTPDCTCSVPAPTRSSTRPRTTRRASGRTRRSSPATTTCSKRPAASWDNPPSLPPQGADDPRVAHLVDAAHEALAGLREHEVTWGFKDPADLASRPPFWMDLEPDLQFMICVRHPLEVALSLKRRNQNSYSLGSSLWEKYYATLVETVPRERRIVTHYDAFFADPAGELAPPVRLRRAATPPSREFVPICGTTTSTSVSSTPARARHSSRCTRSCVEKRMSRCPPSHHATKGECAGSCSTARSPRRHAAQRQQAIERLEERLRENQAEHKELWEKRSQESQRREDEARQRQADAEALQRRRQADTEALQRRLVRDLAEINQRTRRTDLRVERAVQAVTLRSARRALRRWARRSARLGEANIVKPGKRIARRGARVAVPRAKVVVVPPRTFSREATAGPRPRRPAPRSYRSTRARTSRRRANGASRSAPKASGEKGSAPGTRAMRGTTPKNWQRKFEQARRRDGSRTRAVAHLHGRDTGLGPTRWYRRPEAHFRRQLRVRRPCPRW